MRAGRAVRAGRTVKTGRGWRFLTAFTVLPVLTAFTVLPALTAFTVLPVLHAQTDPRLVAAVHEAQEGQGDSARAKVQALLDSTPTTDSLYPEILYTQAMVAGSAAEMRRQLQRVTVEYSASSWADDALLRLVQMDYATRNLEGAARNLERLRLDYSGSPLMPQASYWAARTYFDQNNPALACRWLAEGMAQARQNIELQNQLAYLNQRCRSLPDTAVANASAQADSAKSKKDSVSNAAGDSTGRPGRAPGFRVQVAAVATSDAADAMAAKVRALGFSVTTVREKKLFKVRAGQFTTRSEAQAAAARIKAKLGGSPFVVSGT
jgi:cell division septation protein DedD